ncbi:MAG: hypothetical protein IPL28_08325 [Chloroflexi bacterium]|nr:hypothetical protein [Chloroflexota bacterium]
MCTPIFDEAAVILSKPALREAAVQFRHSARAWDALSEALLPEDVPLLHETRTLLLRRRDSFVAQGNGAVAEMKQIDGRLQAIHNEAEANFPLTAAEVTTLCHTIAEHVLRVHDIETEAVALLKAALA